ncbi:MAG: hypothetical protein COA52_19745 [Hyphomicrobiales bacterium]|nr:MAG: hypothetical protein COA52_19745 [Hyphomicrobiales bacterium]
MRVKILKGFILGTIVLLCFLGVLERLGLSVDLVARLLFALVLVCILFAGARARSLHTLNIFVDGYRMTPLPNGMAMAIIAIGAVGYSYWPGDVYARQLNGLIMPLGVIGGLALMAALFTPHLRREGILTPIEFLLQRFNSKLLVLFVSLISIIVVLLLILAQISIFSDLARRYTTVPPESALLVVLVATVLPLVLGGMRAASWLQMTMAVLAALGFLLPLAWLAFDLTGLPLPHLNAGSALEATKLLQEDAILRGFATSADTSWLEQLSANRLSAGLSLLGIAIGISALPPLLARTQTTRSAKESDVSMGWAIVILLGFVVTMPLYAVFMRLHLTELLTGLNVNSMSDSAGFLFEIKSGLKLCGSVIATPQDAIDACGSGHRLIVSDLDIPAASFIAIFPALAAGVGAAMPETISAMLACGALAAMIAILSACIITLAHILAFDLYAKLLTRSAPMNRIVFFVRVSVGPIIMAIYWLITDPLFDPFRLPPQTMMALALALTAGGLFPVYVMGFWMRSLGWFSAIVASLAGSGLTLYLAALLNGLVKGGVLHKGMIVLPLLGDVLPLAVAGLAGAGLGLGVGILFGVLTPNRKPKAQTAKEQTAKA